MSYAGELSQDHSQHLPSSNLPKVAQIIKNKSYENSRQDRVILTDYLLQFEYIQQQVQQHEGDSSIVEKLFRHLKIIEFPPSTFIYKKGQRNNLIHLLVQGKVSAWRMKTKEEIDCEAYLTDQVKRLTKLIENEWIVHEAVNGDTVKEEEKQYQNQDQQLVRQRSESDSSLSAIMRKYEGNSQLGELQKQLLIVKRQLSSITKKQKQFSQIQELEAMKPTRILQEQNEVFGQQSVLTGQRPSESILAETHTIIITILGDAFFGIFMKELQNLKFILQILFNKFSKAKPALIEALAQEFTSHYYQMHANILNVILESSEEKKQIPPTEVSYENQDNILTHHNHQNINTTQKESEANSSSNNNNGKNNEISFYIIKEGSVIVKEIYQQSELQLCTLEEGSIIGLERLVLPSKQQQMNQKYRCKLQFICASNRLQLLGVQQKEVEQMSISHQDSSFLELIEEFGRQRHHFYITRSNKLKQSIQQSLNHQYNQLKQSQQQVSLKDYSDEEEDQLIAKGSIKKRHANRIVIHPDQNSIKHKVHLKSIVENMLQFRPSKEAQQKSKAKIKQQQQQQELKKQQQQKEDLKEVSNNKYFQRISLTEEDNDYEQSYQQVSLSNSSISSPTSQSKNIITFNQQFLSRKAQQQISSSFSQQIISEKSNFHKSNKTYSTLKQTPSIQVSVDASPSIRQATQVDSNTKKQVKPQDLSPTFHSYQKPDGIKSNQKRPMSHGSRVTTSSFAKSNENKFVTSFTAKQDTFNERRQTTAACSSASQRKINIPQNEFPQSNARLNSAACSTPVQQSSPKFHTQAYSMSFTKNNEIESSRSIFLANSSAKNESQIANKVPSVNLKQDNCQKEVRIKLEEDFELNEKGFLTSKKVPTFSELREDFITSKNPYAKCSDLIEKMQIIQNENKQFIQNSNKEYQEKLTQKANQHKKHIQILQRSQHDDFLKSSIHSKQKGLTALLSKINLLAGFKSATNISKDLSYNNTRDETLKNTNCKPENNTFSDSLKFALNDSTITQHMKHHSNYNNFFKSNNSIILAEQSQIQQTHKGFISHLHMPTSRESSPPFDTPIAIQEDALLEQNNNNNGDSTNKFNPRTPSKFNFLKKGSSQEMQDNSSLNLSKTITYYFCSPSCTNINYNKLGSNSKIQLKKNDGSRNRSQQKSNEFAAQKAATSSPQIVTNNLTSPKVNIPAPQNIKTTQSITLFNSYQIVDDKQLYQTKSINPSHSELYRPSSAAALIKFQAEVQNSKSSVSCIKNSKSPLNDSCRVFFPIFKPKLQAKTGYRPLSGKARYDSAEKDKKKETKDIEVQEQQVDQPNKVKG